MPQLLPSKPHSIHNSSVTQLLDTTERRKVKHKKFFTISHALTAAIQKFRGKGISHIQSDSKLLSVFLFIRHGNPDNNLESSCILMSA
jgi:hypothetical protein